MVLVLLMIMIIMATVTMIINIENNGNIILIKMNELFFILELEIYWEKVKKMSQCLGLCFFFHENSFFNKIGVPGTYIEKIIRY